MHRAVYGQMHAGASLPASLPAGGSGGARFTAGNPSGNTFGYDPTKGIRIKQIKDDEAGLRRHSFFIADPDPGHELCVPVQEMQRNGLMKGVMTPMVSIGSDGKIKVPTGGDLNHVPMYRRVNSVRSLRLFCRDGQQTSRQLAGVSRALARQGYRYIVLHEDLYPNFKLQQVEAVLTGLFGAPRRHPADGLQVYTL